LLEYKIPIDKKFVKLARDIADKIGFDIEYYFNKLSDNEYQISNIRLINANDNSCVYSWDNFQIYKTIYSVNFVVPRNCIINDTAKEMGGFTEIIINKWAFENCFVQSINRCIENWGKSIFALLQLPDNSPQLKNNIYKKIVYNLKNDDNRRMERNIKERDKKMGNRTNIQSENVQIAEREIINNVRQGTENTDGSINNKRGKEIPIFHADGKGNIYQGERRSRTGWYNLLLENTGEKWHKEEDLTSNQAELKGLISAFIIAEKRGYEEFLIYTDSQNAINWGNGTSGAKSDNIVSLVNILKNKIKKFPMVQIKHVSRDQNKAHSI